MSETREDAKNPNFLVVVIISAVALLVIFLGAYLLLSDKGRKLLPGLHHDPHPTSYVLPPVSGAITS
jgi:hypothetical protein